ncbi:MAG: serine hydrolase [Terriglobia bacterium]|nr:serine hydrolase [Terriglobia bacterium]
MSFSGHNPLPVAAFSGQDQRFARAFSILEEAVSSRAFPGAAVSVTHRGEIVALKAVGHFTYDTNSPKVEPSTIYDIASVTKVVATTTAAVILYDQGSLDLNAKVADFFPEFGTEPGKKRVTVRMLLAHSSGLPAYEKLFERAKSRAEILRLALEMPLAHPPLDRAEYSDIGFIILGEILSKLARQPLDRFCDEQIFKPLRMSFTGYHPREDWRTHIVPTVNNDFRGRIIQGEVHDENAWVMGGISGHAGVFSNVTDLAQFALCMLRLGSPIVKPSTLNLFTRREEMPAGSSRTLGWDTPSSPSQSGQYFSQRSFGHLGYTGTSLWCDPVRQLSVTLLTNRVWPDRSSQAIKYVRPRFHDAVVEALEV